MLYSSRSPLPPPPPLPFFRTLPLCDHVRRRSFRRSRSGKWPQSAFPLLPASQVRNKCVPQQEERGKGLTQISLLPSFPRLGFARRKITLKSAKRQKYFSLFLPRQVSHFRFFSISLGGDFQSIGMGREGKGGCDMTWAAAAEPLAEEGHRRRHPPYSPFDPVQSPLSSKAARRRGRQVTSSRSPPPLMRHRRPSSPSLFYSLHFKAPEYIVGGTVGGL